ncbi:type 1 glutamine amidotransferase domain-containing protein (plasmid) [Lichenicola cladoniae]|uniref:Type 1 glutamine amidotransferase domain-containing protein n=1 Tax=Lichenicola cladoniae TaxID=1484109 RepID=A0A6M8HYF2_9PROT|nr:type 1 glutamine amidotransferase domain-containing protein [Lichenicola cladoniae]NPD70253.1 type 1 glutamine amidotransferase domain-containing protein [Acetobacteraceae bacterium]QKE93370.1 type 1 glutamine amidotransferase domain-containing protein [Lichenicola cladoniae]
MTSSETTSAKAKAPTSRVLFLVSSAEIGFWLAELTHPFWHLTERGASIDLASPKGGKIVPDRTSDPYAEGSWEADDLVSRGFLGQEVLKARLGGTLAIKDVNPDDYDAVHVVGGGGAAVDLYPNSDVARVLERFFALGKIVGTICHGSIALANVPKRVAGRRATGFSRVEDAQVEDLYGADFIPNFPQPVMEAAGIVFSCVEPWGVHVVIDKMLITGQNQQSASEYAIAFNHLLAGSSPVVHDRE